MKYNFSIKIDECTFGVDGADSFDEAILKVKRGVADYQLSKLEAQTKCGNVTNSKPDTVPNLNKDAKEVHVGEPESHTLPGMEDPEPNSEGPKDM